MAKKKSKGRNAKQKTTKRHWKSIEKVYSSCLKKYSLRENVTGIDIGYKYEGAENKLTKKLAVRIHVNHKIEESILEASQKFPETVDDVLIDIIEANYQPHNDPLFPKRIEGPPIQPGKSISHFSGGSGTIGLVVYDSLTGERCALSNFHVLGMNREGTIRNSGDKIISPGTNDGGDHFRNSVGRLGRNVLNERGDAALVRIDHGIQVNPKTVGSEVEVKNTIPVELGMELEKSGLRTGITRGKVEGIGRYFVKFNHGRIGIDGFKLVPADDMGQELSGKGDSGSVWYEPESGAGVGLHFGGELSSDTEQEFGLACHLDLVLNELNASLTPVAGPPLAQVASVAESAGELDREFDRIGSDSESSKTIQVNGDKRVTIKIEININ